MRYIYIFQMEIEDYSCIDLNGMVVCSSLFAYQNEKLKSAWLHESHEVSAI